MEELKSLIPDDLKRMIGESLPENLSTTCSSLLDFLAPLPPFQRVIKELTDPQLALCRKNLEKALDLKQSGNECFSKGDYEDALRCYTKALRYAPIDSSHKNRKLVATIYVNRASTLHKLAMFEECLRDCNRAIRLSPDYVKAWYRRGKSNMLLKSYDAAIHDLKVALSMEDSASGKKHIQEDLEVALKHSSDACLVEKSCKVDCHKDSTALGEPSNVRLKCVTTPGKGRGMVSVNDIIPGSLVHSEEPIAAIVAKPFRETHCHFCFNELPIDVVFCPLCTIPFYCSQYCLEQATGEVLQSKLSSYPLSANLEKHARDIIPATQDDYAISGGFEHIPEHRHECGGFHWAVVLPSDVVLAGRIMVNNIEKNKISKVISGNTLELVHNYRELTSPCKVDLHIYAIVLMHCLQICYALDLPPNGVSAAQLVLIICQIKINSIGIIRMKWLDGYGASKIVFEPSCLGNSSTSTMEQVRVGQALYSTGSLFNHSCLPNIHAYFISRSLFLRATEYIPSGSPVELSYGPQVGQWDLHDRQELLKEQYSFRCNCSGCSELKFPDLIINSYRCVNCNCLGAVMESTHFERLDDGILRIISGSVNSKLSLPLKVSKRENDISKVANMLLSEPRSGDQLGPGSCLSCDSYRDMKASSVTSGCAFMNIKRIKVSVDSGRFEQNMVVDIMHSHDQLKSVRHPYSKIIAEAEDIIAEMFVNIGEAKNALTHCEASLQILEKLYHSKHIVLANEFMKLASIQVTLRDQSAALNSIEKLEAIFKLYYGPHTSKMFPSIASLRKSAENLR